MTLDKLKASFPPVWNQEFSDKIASLYMDAKYLYDQSCYGCDCLDGYYTARKNIDSRSAEKLATAGELHYHGLVTILTALCGAGMHSVTLLYDSLMYESGGVIDVMDRVTDLSDGLTMLMKNRGEDTGKPDSTGNGFEGPAGEMARRSVGISAVVERYRQVNRDDMLDTEHLDETYMILRGMLQCGCELMRYIMRVISGENVPSASSPDRSGAALVIGPLASGMVNMARKMGD